MLKKRVATLCTAIALSAGTYVGLAPQASADAFYAGPAQQVDINGVYQTTQGLYVQNPKLDYNDIDFLLDSQSNQNLILKAKATEKTLNESNNFLDRIGFSRGLQKIGEKLENRGISNTWDENAQKASLESLRNFDRYLLGFEQEVLVDPNTTIAHSYTLKAIQYDPESDDLSELKNKIGHMTHAQLLSQAAVNNKIFDSAPEGSWAKWVSGNALKLMAAEIANPSYSHHQKAPENYSNKLNSWLAVNSRPDYTNQDVVHITPQKTAKTIYTDDLVPLTYSSRKATLKSPDNSNSHLAAMPLENLPRPRLKPDHKKQDEPHFLTWKEKRIHDSCYIKYRFPQPSCDVKIPFEETHNGEKGAAFPMIMADDHTMRQLGRYLKKSGPAKLEATAIATQEAISISLEEARTATKITDNDVKAVLKYGNARVIGEYANALIEIGKYQNRMEKEKPGMVSKFWQENISSKNLPKKYSFGTDWEAEGRDYMTIFLDAKKQAKNLHATIIN